MTGLDVRQMERTFETEAGELLPALREDVVLEFNRMVDNFNGAWWHQALAARWLTRRAIDQIRGDLVQLLEVVDHALDHYVPVLSLFGTSIAWTERVMTPLSEVYGAIPPGHDNLNLHYWDDAARRVYNDIVTDQQQATGAARGLASFMSRWLAGIAQANTEYATHLVGVLAEVLGNLVKAAAEAASVIGLPFAIQDLAGLIGDLVKGLINTLARVTQDLVGAVERVIDAENEVADHSHFPGGQWPVAVSRA